MKCEFLQNLSHAFQATVNCRQSGDGVATRVAGGLPSGLVLALPVERVLFVRRQESPDKASTCRGLLRFERERTNSKTHGSERRDGQLSSLPPPSPVEGVFCRSAERVARCSVHVLKVPERDEFSETLNRISGQVKESSGQPG